MKARDTETVRNVLRTVPAIFTLTAILSIGQATLGAQEKSGLEIGDRAVDFSLPGVDGKTYSLEDFEGAKALVLIFTCNHCPTAQAYEERIKKLAEDCKKKDVALVAISPNDPKAVRLNELGYTDVGDTLEDMKLRARAEDFNFPYLYDGETQKTSRAYGPNATPHAFVFDADRKLRYSGRIDNDESGKDIKSHDLRNAIEAVLAGKEVPAKKTRTFGCSIKWSDKRDDNKRYLEKLSKEKVELEDLDVAAAKKLRQNDSGKLRLINLWATWCAPCRAEFPDLVETDRMYRHRDFEFVSISLDDPDKRALVLKVLQGFEASNKNYLFTGDDRDAFADALYPEWTGALPLTILVKPGGKVIYAHEGQIDPLKLRRQIVKVLGRTYHEG